MQLPQRRHEKLKKYDDSPIYLTAEGFQRLKEKLERLKKSLPALIAETQRTAAYGDRSDNAEYKEVKSTLRRTHWQILSTENHIKRTFVIKSVPDNSEIIRIGSSIVLESEGKKKTFQILGSHEADPAKGRISNESPLGKNLLGKKIGETISIQTKNGIRKYTILEVL